jgi:protein-S-isoprenylcysteine O-methyltransferase Ste14
VSRLLVALQFGLMALIAVRLDPAAVGFGFLALVVLGLAVGGWALWANRPGNFHIRPDPHPEGALVTHGPYARVRHPMYLSVLLVMAAFALAGDAWQWLAWALLAGVLAAKARREERGLAILHPGYEAYRARTRAIVPFLF